MGRAGESIFVNKQASSLRQRLADFSEPGATLLLVLMLFGDLVYIGLHFVHAATPFLESRIFSLQRDSSYSEYFQFMKFFWIILMFLYIWRVTRVRSYGAWILVFGYFLFDDALQIHERVGELIAGHLNFAPPFNLRLVDVGELIVSATAGGILLLVLAWAYLRGPDTFKKVTRDILLLVLALAFFGVGVDMAHSAMRVVWVLDLLLVMIEDGGEMIVVSLMVWYVFLLSLRKGKAPSYLWDIMIMPLLRKLRLSETAGGR
jgi:hypothetical protein